MPFPFSSHHPPLCILQLGIQYSEELICGSNARCIAILAAFRKVIQDYTTPEQKELRRDLDAVIKPHIKSVQVLDCNLFTPFFIHFPHPLVCSFLSQCRPLSVSMGNAIKYLKLKISQIPPEMTESDVCNYYSMLGVVPLNYRLETVLIIIKSFIFFFRPKHHSVRQLIITSE